MRISLDLAVTKRCNMRCPHCYSSGGDESEKEVDSNTFIKAMFDLADEVGSDIRFRITGGEPFLKEGLLEILKAARDISSDVDIETNGTLIDAKVASQISDYVNQVAVSLDTLRGDGRTGVLHIYPEKAITGIKHLIEHNIKTQVITTVTHANINEISDIMRFCLDVGVDSHRILANINIMGRAVENFPDINVMYLKEIYRKVFDLVLDNGAELPISSNIPYALVPVEVMKKMKWGGCDPRDKTAILPNGDVTLCAACTDPKLSVGNILEEPLPVLHWKKRAKFFMRFNELQGVCGKCIFRVICLGYCRAYSLSYYGSMNAPHPVCQAFYDAKEFPRDMLDH